jgi:hypothetical protein
MEELPSTVNPEYAHLFHAPIDAVFDILPYRVWEVMASEINRYAEQFLRMRNRTKISGYQWNLVSIKEVITYFGLLIFAVLYPQTGQRFHSAWNNPSLHPWTNSMTRWRMLQITSMLHFNNNEDHDGMQQDSLHKMWPLPEIIKNVSKVCNSWL